MVQFIHYAALLACVAVIIACICRIDLMRSTRNSYVWFFVYAMFGAYAFGTALELCRGRAMDWNDAAGIGGILLMVLASWSRWVKGAPPETVRGEP